MKTKTLLNLLKKLRQLEAEIKLLESTEALLHWDKATSLPKKAVAQRGEQLSYISTLAHKKKLLPSWKKSSKTSPAPNTSGNFLP